MSTKIAHNNKDLVGKILADTFREKSFAVWGIDLPRVARCLPAEFPEVYVTDRIADRLFLLEDGSYALVDFESEYRFENKIKYLRYITQVLARYLNESHEIRLRLIVLYMGNVQSAQADFSTDCISIHTEQAFLSHINGDVEFEKIRDKLDEGQSLSDEDLARLVILPLTYSKREEQVSMIDRVIDAAILIDEDEKKAFVLAGICIAADKFISDRQMQKIGGLLKMSRVGQMLQKEFEEMEKQLEQRLEETEARISEMNVQISQKDAQISQKDARINEQDAQISQKDARINEQDAQISQKDARINEQDAQISQKDARINEQDAQIHQRDQHILFLQQSRENTIRNLLLSGEAIERIMLLTGADASEIKQVRDRSALHENG